MLVFGFVCLFFHYEVKSIWDKGYSALLSQRKYGLYSHLHYYSFIAAINIWNYANENVTFMPSCSVTLNQNSTWPVLSIWSLFVYLFVWVFFNCICSVVQVRISDDLQYCVCMSLFIVWTVCAYCRTINHGSVRFALALLYFVLLSEKNHCLCFEDFRKLNAWLKLLPYKIFFLWKMCTVEKCSVFLIVGWFLDLQER